MRSIRIPDNARMTVLTGAGISAESGIATFRGNNGLWENHRMEEVATPEAFERNPEMVWRFYKYRYKDSLSAQPNAAHSTLKDVEEKLGEGFNLITQNVDGLHLRSGCKRVIEMHGALDRCFCTDCNTRYKMEDIDLSDEIPECKCGGVLRPDIVWFGEIPYCMDEIYRILEKTEILLVVGTSGSVYPAAQFLMHVRYSGGYAIGVNLDKPDNFGFFNEFHQGKAGELLPQLSKLWFK